MRINESRERRTFPERAYGGYRSLRKSREYIRGKTNRRDTENGGHNESRNEESKGEEHFRKC
jgi:hypothetical protein